MEDATKNSMKELRFKKPVDFTNLLAFLTKRGGIERYSIEAVRIEDSPKGLEKDVVFVHGGLSFADSFVGQAESLTAVINNLYFIIAYDAKGKSSLVGKSNFYQVGGSVVREMPGVIHRARSHFSRE